MRLLLDTHAMLWWIGGNPRLGPAARGMIEDAANEVLVSVASLWEAVVKQRVGKLEADLAHLVAALEESGFATLGITMRHLEALAALPAHHRDPFDHLLVAQAIAEDAALLTTDARLAAYPLRVLDCAR